MMTRIVVEKSTDNAKSHAIGFLPQYRLKKKMSFAEPKLKKALRYKLKRCLVFYRQRQISQSDCEISSNSQFKTSLLRRGSSSSLEKSALQDECRRKVEWIDMNLRSYRSANSPHRKKTL